MLLWFFDTQVIHRRCGYWDIGQREITLVIILFPPKSLKNSLKIGKIPQNHRKMGEFVGICYIDKISTGPTQPGDKSMAALTALRNLFSGFFQVDDV